MDYVINIENMLCQGSHEVIEDRTKERCALDKKGIGYCDPQKNTFRPIAIHTYNNKKKKVLIDFARNSTGGEPYFHPRILVMTKESRNRPKVYEEPMASGFGFDSVNDDYKIVRILRNIVRRGNDVEVYSLSSGKWKEVPINVPRITGMEFGVISLPTGSRFNIDGLMVLEERLCILASKFCTDKEIWVMKDYGVTTSWAKEYVLKR
ncbi:hypothetical protein IFM89_037029 [Coptis chinensis]|uniref:F-box associated domain-containing protein n=1 Tax=Coptis chinensis TaxID=261450 RepID=A0A835LPS3_9MAGN|nr:hypothetical protein IFM89_037029 [Coptis chinensis]